MSNTNPVKNRTSLQTDTGDLGGRKLLIQEARGALDTFFKKDVWLSDEVIRVLNLYWYEEAEKQAMQEQIMRMFETAQEEYEQNGEYINPLGDPGFREEFKMSTWGEFRKLLYSDFFDPLTRLGAMSPFPMIQGATDSFDERTAKFFLKNFYEWGFGVITGLPGSGKSDFACRLMEMALDEGFCVATNIKIRGDLPDGLRYTTSFKELLVICIDNLKAGKKTLIFLDEMPQFFTKKRATSGKYLTFEKVLFLLRKVGGNLIGLIQRPSDIPSVMAEFSKCYFQKLNKKTLLFQRDDANVHILGNVPGTTLDYDTRDQATFSVDLDLQALQEYISHLEKDADQLQAMKDFIEGGIADGNPDSELQERRIAMKYLRKIGKTQQEIADDIGTNQSEVSRRLRE
jgi:hypothetical protein